MMKQRRIAIIDYKMSNLFSIKNALDKIGIESFITSDSKKILSSDGAILPGVGSFPEAMRSINNLELAPVLKDFIASGKPFMGICLGMQVLFSESGEFQKTKGLDILNGSVLPLSGQDIIRLVPHVGWNNITKKQSKATLTIFDNIDEEPFFYFVHSFYVEPDLDEVISSYTEYTSFKFCSSVVKDNIFASQFHPEKSGEDGLMVLKNFFIE